MQHRRRHPGFGQLYRAAAGERGTDDTQGTPPGQPSLREALATRRPSAIDAPLSPVTSPRPAAQSAALATTVAGQQQAAGPSNGSQAAPPIPPPPAVAAMPAPPQRAYPMPAPGGPPPVSGFWGGDGGNVLVTQPGAMPAVPAVPAAGGGPATPAVPAVAARPETDDEYVARFMPPGMSQASPFYAMQRDAILARRAVEANPANQAAIQRQSDETNALRAAQTASMGMLTGTPQFSSGVADPAAAFQQFEQSGYTGSQALADGWLTGVGTPGWQNQATPAAPATPGGPSGPAVPATPATPARAPDPYAPPGYTPGAAAPGPATAPPPGAGTVVDTQRTQQGAPPARQPAPAPGAPPPMRPLSSYFNHLNRAAGG